MKKEIIERTHGDGSKSYLGRVTVYGKWFSKKVYMVKGSICANLSLTQGEKYKDKESAMDALDTAVAEYLDNKVIKIKSCVIP